LHQMSRPQLLVVCFHKLHRCSVYMLPCTAVHVSHNCSALNCTVGFFSILPPHFIMFNSSRVTAVQCQPQCQPFFTFVFNNGHYLECPETPYGTFK
jgi:hypothetical protein